MKPTPIDSRTLHGSFWPVRVIGCASLITAVGLAAPISRIQAADAADPAPAKVEKPAPLPLHQIEGNGGIFSTLSAYVVNKHFTIAAGYGHFGGVLNHQANGVWGITTKYEF